jgi:hypothetical protein
VSTEHLTAERVAAFAARRLSAGELLAVDDHLAVCPDCRRRLRAAWPVEDALQAWQGVVAGEPAAAPARPPERWRTAAAVSSLLGLAAALLAVLLVQPEVDRGPNDAPEVGTGPATLPTPRETPPEPPATVLRDGRLAFGVTAQGTVSGLDALPAAWRERIAEALRSGRLPLAPLADELAGSTAALRGAGEADDLALLAPVATAVAEATPLFRWEAAPGATHYRVRVFTGDFQLAAESPPLSATRWRPDALLPVGETLSWQVTVTLEDDSEITAPRPPAPEARFVVLTPGEAAALSAALAELAPSRLGRAVAYAAAGCRQDAARELAALSADNPESPLARGLLAGVAPAPLIP